MCVSMHLKGGVANWLSHFFILALCQEEKRAPMKNENTMGIYSNLLHI